MAALSAQLLAARPLQATRTSTARAPSACTVPVARFGAVRAGALSLQQASRSQSVRPKIARRQVVVASSNNVEFQDVDAGDGVPGSEYTAVFALIAFAANYFNQFNVNVPFLLKAFALFSLVNAASAIVYNQSSYDKIGTVIAPAILGANVVLRQYDALALIVAVFGWYISYDLKGLPFWGCIATLAAAIYYNYGLHWVVIAYAYGTITRLLDGLENDKVPVVSVPILAVSLFAFLKEYKSVWVISLAFGEVARSFYNLMRRVKDEEPQGLKDIIDSK